MKTVSVPLTSVVLYIRNVASTWVFQTSHLSVALCIEYQWWYCLVCGIALAI